MDERKYVLSVKDEDGNWVHIPALKGDSVEDVEWTEDRHLVITGPKGKVTDIDEIDDALTDAEAATASATSAASTAASAASTATSAAGQATSAATEANSAADAANTAAGSATSAATSANTAAATATSAASNANTKASLADEKATLAAEKAALADEKATAANTAATSATSAASSATSAAGSANTAASSATSAASAATTAAGSATSAATSANTAATNANEKATLAQTAATAADAAREAIQDDLAAKADKTYVDAADAAQSSRIATKAEKSALASTDREVVLIRKAIEGQLMEVEEDHTAAYSKTLPSGTIGVGVNMIGGKSVVWNQKVDCTYIGDSTRYEVNVTNYENKLKITNVSRTENFSSGATYGNYRENKIVGHKYYTTSDTAGVGVQVNGVYHVNTIFTAQETGNSGIVICLTSAYDFESIHTVGDITYASLFCIDLTEMFGSGNEPTTTSDPSILAIEAYLSEHPEYNSGEIISADCEGITSDGFNLLNPAQKTLGRLRTSNGEINPGAEGTSLYVSEYIEVTPNKEYYFKIPDINSDNYGTAWYDENKVFISAFGQKATNVNTTRRPPANAKYLRCTFNGGATNDCINISQPNTASSPHNGDYVAYSGRLGQLSISQGLRQAKPLLSAPNVYDDYNLEDMKGHQRVGTRAHQEGDEDDATVITDGTTTQYPLATPVEYDLTPYFPEGFSPLLNAEAGGSITFKQTSTEFPLPNSTDYFVKTTPTVA